MDYSKFPPRKDRTQEMEEDVNRKLREIRDKLMSDQHKKMRAWRRG